MDFVCIDVETANESTGSVCQVGLAAFFDGAHRPDLDRTWFVDPEEPFSPYLSNIHGLTASDVAGSANFSGLHAMLHPLLEGKRVLMYGPFDRVSLNKAAAKYGLAPFKPQWLNVLRVARQTWPELKSKSGHSLEAVSRHCGHISTHQHDALEDARACGAVVLKACAVTNSTLDDWYRHAAETTPQQRIKHRDGNPQGHLSGEVVVFTGESAMPRPEMQRLALEAGCAVDAGVTKRTTLLVVGIQNPSLLAGKAVSSKHQNALDWQEKGKPLRIVSNEDFFALLYAVDRLD